MSKRVSVHSFAALLGALIVGIATLQSSALGGSLRNGQELLDIGVEHQQPLSLGFTVSTNTKNTLIDFANNGEETIFISVPDRWEKREVRNVPIDQVIADDSSFGFRRWHLPPNAGIQYWSRSTDTRFLVHNPTGVPLKVVFTQVDLASQQTASDIVLIQNSSVELSADAL